MFPRKWAKQKEWILVLIPFFRARFKALKMDISHINSQFESSLKDLRCCCRAHCCFSMGKHHCVTCLLKSILVQRDTWLMGRVSIILVSMWFYSDILKAPFPNVQKYNRCVLGCPNDLDEIDHFANAWLRHFPYTILHRSMGYCSSVSFLVYICWRALTST